jgi:hypothetical protein
VCSLIAAVEYEFRHSIWSAVHEPVYNTVDYSISHSDRIAISDKIFDTVENDTVNFISNVTHECVFSKTEYEK